MILIAKDLVAGETLDEKNHLSYSPEIRPRHKLLKLGTLG